MAEERSQYFRDEEFTAKEAKAREGKPAFASLCVLCGEIQEIQS